MLRIVAERADHLARLVEDLLLASRISSEPGGTAVVGMQPECTDLAEAARRAAADWLRGPDSRLELELPPGPLEVDAGPLRLVQLLANLISNAHKYSPHRSGGPAAGVARQRLGHGGGGRPGPLHPPRGARPGVREVPPGRGPDDHDHRRHRPRPLHRPRADPGHGRGDRGDQRPPPGLDLHRPPAAAPTPPTAATTPGRPAATGPTTSSRPTPGLGGPPTRCAAAPDVCPGDCPSSRRWCTILGVDGSVGERGVTAVAYAVMVAIIALLLVGGVFVLSDSIKAALTGGAECVASPGACEGGSGGGGPGGGGDGGGGGGGGSTTTSTQPASSTTTTTTTTVP